MLEQLKGWLEDYTQSDHETELVKIIGSVTAPETASMEYNDFNTAAVLLECKLGSNETDNEKAKFILALAVDSLVGMIQNRRKHSEAA